MPRLAAHIAKNCMDFPTVAGIYRRQLADQPFDSHQEYNELQTDQNPLLYLASAAAVFLAYLLHLGFAPALLLGRLANLLLFAALAALAVKTAPFGKRVFTVAALLPMTCWNHHLIVPS